MAILAGIVALAWLAVPRIVHDQLEARLGESLKRTTSIGAVDFNPFTLRVVLHDVAVAGRDGAAPLFTADEIAADVSSASLWHRAPVFDALRVVRPSIALSRDAGGRYSIQDLIDEAAAAPDRPMPAFSLNNIEVVDGAVAFDDGTTGRSHRAAALALGIPFLSNLPYATDVRVNPHLSGSFNGSHLVLDGIAVPFAQQREAAIDVDLDALPLRDYVAYLPARRRVDLAGGALTTRLKVVFVEGASDTRTLEIRGSARVDGLALVRRDGSALASAGRLAVDLDRVDLLQRDARIASVELVDPVLDARRLRDGTFELARPWIEADSGPRGPPWSVTIAKASARGGKIALVDEDSTFRSTLVDAALDIANFSTRAGEKAKVSVSFVSDDRVAAFKGEAEVEPLVPAASGTFELRKFSLGLLYPFYRDALAVEVQRGSLELAASFALLADGSFRLSSGTGTISDLTLAHPDSKQAFARFPSIAGSGIDVDVNARRVTIAELASRDATLRIVRNRDGSVDAARLMKTSPATGTSRDEETWVLALAKLVLDRASIDVEDRGPDVPVKLALREFAVTAANVGNARGAKSALTLRTRVGERGRAAWSGTFASNPLAASGRVEISGVDLVPLRPYIESQVDVSLTAGTLAAAGTFDVGTPDGGPAKASWKGSASVTDFAALDKPTSSDLARWKRVSLDDIDVELDPGRVAVGSIAIEDFYARAIVYPDGTLNLTRLLTPTKAASASNEKPARDALPVTLGRIDLARGSVNLSDFFVQPNYNANLTDVGGSVTTMSAEQAGDIAIAARVDHTAPVEVAGRLQPFAKELSLDIKAKARDVDLPPLTPYSVKYAGYGIEKGKLTFDVHYRVENRKLTADNRLVLDQLTFNPQRVDSATATKLPVLLAVALLKDTRGVIDIELPIAGSLDDPEFSVGGLVIRVIVNLIAKAATAPFALLSAAFGRGEELSNIPFPAASTVVDADGAKRLDTLGKALADRPALKLDIGGRADADLDREALRRSSVEGAMKREKIKSLAARGEAPASVDAITIDASERTTWLAAAYRESSIKDRPRNAVGMLRDIPPAEMESIMLADAKVDDDALRALANARAQVVKDALVSRSVPGDRLFITAAHLSGEVAKIPGSGARVDLALR